MLPFVGLTLVSLVLLLHAERRQWRAGIWLFKPLAASGFVATAIAAGALQSSYGRWVLAALALSWLGDVLLIPRGAKLAFLAGLVSFLAGHLLYVVAFALYGVSAPAALLALLLAVPPAVLALRWLAPHLPANMRVPVYAYVAVISAMMVSAAGTGSGIVLLGAAMFYVSDLAVARERFVASSFTNKLWGLPLYFGGQLVLASTVV